MDISSLLGISLPLVQAPMAGVQGSALAIAVSGAGGLGSLPCAMLTAEAIRAEVEAIRAASARPFNLNFFCHRPAPPDAQREQAWRLLLARYYEELGIDPAAIASAPVRAPFSPALAALVEELRPPVVSFHFGLPAPELMARVKRSGAKVLSSATTVEEALYLQAGGVDAVIAQGLEAGGHRGMFLGEDMSTQLGTFALLRRVVAAVDVPVIAAGGIADAQGVAAALALGAAGVQVGSTYLLCPEAGTSTVHRAWLKSPAAGHTAVTNLFSGRPARAIVNRLVAELGPINAAVPPFPHAGAALAPLRAAAEAHGAGDFSPLWCGQNPLGCRELPAATLTRALFEAPA